MPAPTVYGFLPTDPRYAPFGLPWLRGLTVQRVGLLLLAGLMLSTRSAVSGYFDGNLPAALAHLAASAPRNLLTWMPGLLAVTAADNLTAERGASMRIPAFAAAALLGGLLATRLFSPVSCLVFGYPDGVVGKCAPQLGAFERGDLQLFMYAGLYTALLYYASRQRTRAASLRAAQLGLLEADRQLAEARWRSLRAQIEPHFLFNALAHVRRLYQVDPAKGQRMLRDLADYLKGALPGLRLGADTLGREVALVRAYLRLQQIRMGRRLDYDIDVPEDLMGAELPAMMLVTLVENAVRHGLGPKRGGGRIVVRARAFGDRLQLEVKDDGIGLSAGAGTGVGLANTRARLLMRFGAAASFDIASGAQGGVTARLALPLQRHAAAPAAA